VSSLNFWHRIVGASYGFKHGLRIFQDPLTGVFDRSVLYQGLASKLVAQNFRQLSPVAVVMIDVDDLKQVNDGPGGHFAGDALLKTVSTVIDKGVPRDADLVIRYGGDEFLVLLSSTDKEGAQVVMSRIEALLPEGIHISFGICDFVPETREEKAPAIQDMIRRADKAMYTNKAVNKAERRKIRGK